MVKRKEIYFHKITGDICHVSKSKAKKLGAAWQKLEFGKDENGTPRMRFQFDGATVDVIENGQREVITDGNGSTK